MTKKISFLDIFRSIAPWRIKLLKAFDCLVGGTIAFLLPLLSKKEFPQKIKRILIIRPGGLGDAVFLLPILKALKNQGLIVDILCERRNAQVFTSQAELFNAIYLYDQDPFAIFANSYDVIIDTEQWHYLSALAAYFVGSSYKIGFATRPQRAKLFHRAVEYGVDEYELDNFLKLFKGIVNVNCQLEGSFNIDLTTQDWANELIQDKFVALFLGASIVLRRFNEEQVMGIAQHYLKKGNSIVLLGGRDVSSFAQTIAAKINSPKILNKVGALSLIQSAALIQKSSLFIGPDSGLMHLACALGVPVIAVFGPGNLAKWGPKGEKHRIVTENVACCPCTRFGYTVPTCHGQYFCMKNIKISGLESSLNNN